MAGKVPGKNHKQPSPERQHLGLNCVLLIRKTINLAAASLVGCVFFLLSFSFNIRDATTMIHVMSLDAISLSPQGKERLLSVSMTSETVGRGTAVSKEVWFLKLKFRCLLHSCERARAPDLQPFPPLPSRKGRRLRPPESCPETPVRVEALKVPVSSFLLSPHPTL